jgi:hypothetical protein
MTDETCCGACGFPIHATKESACDWCRKSADRIEALTAKLAKAVEALDRLARLGNGDRYGNSEGNVIAQTTIAEIKGESHE